MNRFDEILKAKLDSLDAPLDMGMWNAIESDLGTSNSGTSFRGPFAGGLAATILLAFVFTSLPTLNGDQHEASIASVEEHTVEPVATIPNAIEVTDFSEQTAHDIEFTAVEVELVEAELKTNDETNEVSARGKDNSAILEEASDEGSEELTVNADFGASGIQCPGSEISFSAQKTEGEVTWLLDGVIVKEGAEVSHAFEGHGEHEVIMMTKVDGQDVSVKKTIEIYPAPDFTVESTIEAGDDCITSDVQLIAEPTGYAYEWSINGETAEGEQVEYALLTGNHSVVVKGISAEGCVGVVNHTVFVKDESGMYIPSSFTPDGDGLNDTWAPVGLETTNSYDLKIYTVPEQELVYESSEKIEWDGTNKGLKMPARKNYLYQLKVTDQCGNSETKSGTITTL